VVHEASLEGKRICLSLVKEFGMEKRCIFTQSRSLTGTDTFYFNGLPPGCYHLWMNDQRAGFLESPMGVVHLAPGEQLRCLDLAYVEKPE
jgi:hypothetical protein